MVEAFAVQNCISHCISQTNAPKNDVPVKNSAGGVGIPRVLSVAEGVDARVYYPAARRRQRVRAPAAARPCPSA